MGRVGRFPGGARGPQIPPPMPVAPPSRCPPCQHLALARASLRLVAPAPAPPTLVGDTSAHRAGFSGIMSSPLLPPTSSHRAVPACHVPIESGPPHRRYLAAYGRVGGSLKTSAALHSPRVLRKSQKTRLPTLKGTFHRSSDPGNSESTRTRPLHLRRTFPHY